MRLAFVSPTSWLKHIRRLRSFWPREIPKNVSPQLLRRSHIFTLFIPHPTVLALTFCRACFHIDHISPPLGEQRFQNCRSPRSEWSRSSIRNFVSCFAGLDRRRLAKSWETSQPLFPTQWPHSKDSTERKSSWVGAERRLGATVQVSWQTGSKRSIPPRQQRKSSVEWTVICS